VSELSLWKITRLLRAVTSQHVCKCGQRLQITVIIPVVFSPSFYPQTLINQSSFIHSNNTNNKILNIIVVCLWHASSGVGAAWNTANISAGNTVAIFGLGAVGLAVSNKINK
jgi:Zn-dependent alcohol dehydrogenase